mgnify:CR=1 FL=1
MELKNKKLELEENEQIIDILKKGASDNFKKENFQKNWVKKDKSLNVFLLKSKSEGYTSLLSSSINNG